MNTGGTFRLENPDGSLASLILGDEWLSGYISFGSYDDRSDSGVLEVGDIHAAGTSGSRNLILFFQSNEVVLNNNISGQNFQLYQQATGSTILNGAITVTGDAFIDGGSITFNNTLALDVYQEAGVVTFGENAVVTGSVNVSGTSLLVHHGRLENNLTVNQGSVAQIHGEIAGSVVNGGQLDIQASGKHNSVRIANHLVLQQDSLLNIFLTPKNNRYAALSVGRNAFLDGMLYVGLAGSFNPTGTYKILTADEGIEGSFSQVYLDAALLAGTLVFGEYSIELVIDQKVGFAEFARSQRLGGNALAIGKALDHAQGREQASRIINRLLNASEDELKQAFALLSPEQLAAIYQIGFANAQTQYDNISRRLSDLRFGSAGFSSNGLALSNSRGSLNYDNQPIANTRNGLSLAGWDGKSIVGKNAVAPVITQSRWGFFATGSGEWGDVENTAQALGGEFTTGGVTVGADYRVCPNFVIGIAGGYANTSSDLANGGETEVNSGRGTVYATAFTNSGFYVNAAVGGAYNHYNIRRATLGGKARGKTDGGEFNALFGTGYDYQIGGFSIGPVASIQYTSLGLNRYQETGAIGALEYPDQHQESLKTNLGLQASYTWNLNGILIRPFVSAQWQHEYLDSIPLIEAGFVGASRTFKVSGVELGRDALILDAGASVQINERFSVYASYTGEIGRTNFSSNRVNGGFRFNF